MIFQYATVTTREAIMFALGMGIFADVFAIIVMLAAVRLIVSVRGGGKHGKKH